MHRRRPTVVRAGPSRRQSVRCARRALAVTRFVLQVDAFVFQADDDLALAIRSRSPVDDFRRTVDDFRRKAADSGRPVDDFALPVDNFSIHGDALDRFSGSTERAVNACPVALIHCGALVNLPRPAAGVAGGIVVGGALSPADFGPATDASAP